MYICMMFIMNNKIQHVFINFNDWSAGPTLTVISVYYKTFA